MEECIQAIHSDSHRNLIINIKDVKSLTEIKNLIDVAFSLQDDQVLWYIQEKKCKELPNLRQNIRDYILKKKRIIHCDYLTSTPLMKLKTGIRTHNRILIILAKDIIDTLPDIRYLTGYASQDYIKLINEHEKMSTEAKKMLQSIHYTFES